MPEPASEPLFCTCGHNWSAHSHDDNAQGCASCECDQWWEEIPFWTCPYLARWENEPGHDPNAVCTFSCYDEPACVTGGPWPQREALR